MSTAFPPTIDALERLTRSSAADDLGGAALRGARLPMLVTAGGERDHAIVFVNDAFTGLTGYPAEEVLGRNPRFLRGPETDPATTQAVRDALNAGRELSVELLNYRKDGSSFWNGMFMSPVRGPDGRIAYWFASHLDITPRKSRESALVRAHGELQAAVQQRTDHLRTTAEQKTVLLHEVEHRVKNNLQLITSLIQFQSRRTADPTVKAALRLVQDRISAVAAAHRGLFQTDNAARFDVARFLRDLVDDLVGRTPSAEVDVRFELERVDAEAARAAPLALLINEILAHALNDGFPPGRPGRLLVSLRRGDHRCTIELSDDGQAGVDQLRSELGGEAGIVGILSRQLGAVINWRDNAPGVSARITLPLESA